MGLNVLNQKAVQICGSKWRKYKELSNYAPNPTREEEEEGEGTPPHLLEALEFTDD